MSPHYTRTAQVFHWLIALVIPPMMALGLYMEGLPFSPEKLQYYSWHKWAGVTVFFLVLLRLLWRFTHRPPPLPSHMSAIERFAAQAGHTLLYLLLLAIPLSGWLMSSAKGVPTVWFGLIPLPDLVSRDEALGDLLRAVHQALNLLLVVLVLGHAGAALKHHFINHDDVLKRMLPWKS
jgi:cytochrome b561